MVCFHYNSRSVSCRSFRKVRQRESIFFFQCRFTSKKQQGTTSPATGTRVALQRFRTRTRRDKPCNCNNSLLLPWKHALRKKGVFVCHKSQSWSRNSRPACSLLSSVRCAPTCARSPARRLLQELPTRDHLDHAFETFIRAIFPLQTFLS